MSAAAGGIVPATVTQPRVDAKAGGAQLEIITTPADPVHGSGSLLQAHFKAIAPRNSTEIAAMLNVLGGVGVAVGTASASPLNVAIQPAAQ